MSSTPSQFPPRILIVDDSEFERNLLRNALQRKAGFEVIEATGAAEVDQRFNERKQTPFRLILLDIMMPEVGGVELLQRIRKEENAVELPIIMLTAKTENQDVVQCLQAGANDYITKPVQFDVAISRIETHLSISRLSREMSSLKEIAALHAMVSTYNHEINNPLAVAMASLEVCSKAWESVKASLSPGAIPAMERLRGSLHRVADVVRKIEAVTQGRQVNLEDAQTNSPRVKI